MRRAVMFVATWALGIVFHIPLPRHRMGRALTAPMGAAGAAMLRRQWADFAMFERKRAQVHRL